MEGGGGERSEGEGEVRAKNNRISLDQSAVKVDIRERRIHTTLSQSLDATTR